jgi:flagellar protein FlgJ
MDLNTLDSSVSINKEQISNLLGDRIVHGRQAAEQQSPEEIRKAAAEFEGFFIQYLLKVMRQTVPTGLIDNKMGHLFDSFYDQEIGVRGAQAGGIGLADLMVRAYTQNQGFETKNNVKTLSSPPESLPIQGSRG